MKPLTSHSNPLLADIRDDNGWAGPGETPKPMPWRIFATLEKLIEEKGWTFEIDGERFVAPEAPEDVIRLYDSLRQIGYANGFFE